MTAVRATPERVVIVGASVAGVAVARALRAEGYERDVVLLGAEPHWPYDKPPLSKQILSGEWEPARASLLAPDEAEELALDVRLGVRAERLDVARRELLLGDGSRCGFGACVVATGSEPRPSPWPERPGVHVLRTLTDALAIRRRFEAGGTVVVVGGGFIGAEVASSARALGLPTTIVDPLPVPMRRLVGSEPGRLFTELAARNGVDLRLGRGVEAIDGAAGDLTIRLTDGSTVEADTAVVGIGVLPSDRWLASSGLPIDDGLVCDELCRASVDGSVFAVGDVARWYHPVHQRLVRVEHWTNAVDQAACVAHNLTHPDDGRPYAPIPYVWTDQHGCKLQIVGRPASASEQATIGAPGAQRPRAAVVYADGSGCLAGALAVNWPRALAECRRGMAVGVDAASVARSLNERLS